LGELCCIVLQCVAVYCSVLQRVAVCCSVLQCVAVCCSVLQCVAVCCTSHVVGIVDEEMDGATEIHLCVVEREIHVFGGIYEHICT